jgi:hypothetical protein
MNALTAEAVLQTWEHARGEHPLRRSLALLRAAWPEVDGREWGSLPVGARDACLCKLQVSLFGPELDTLVACPACDEPLQTRFSTADLLGPRNDPEPDLGAFAGEAAGSLSCGGFELSYRLPCSDDLLAVADAQYDDPQLAAQALLDRCVLGARREGSPAATQQLPPAVIDRLQQEMALRDPGADATVALACPACGHAFERRFDTGAYLWDELDDWAQRTLAEVHQLARAYGWSEPQILALSAARRAHYIALVQA